MGNQPYKKTLERADAFFAKVATETPQHLQCGRGCSFCCYGLFEIGSGDVTVIAEGLEQLHPMRRKKIIRRAQEILDAAGPRDDRQAFFDRTDDVACPNLDENGLCMMYEHRPMVCRTFGLPIREGSEYIGDICELNFTEASQADKERAAWDLQEEDVYGNNELTIPEAIVITARMRGWAT
ncbi:MAG TPA: YkgJ family cysteine cluster protein [Thermoanaerobaculia bacterium]